MIIGANPNAPPYSSLPYGIEWVQQLNAPTKAESCTYGMAEQQHFHAHISLFVGGSQYAIPAAVGIYKASNQTADGGNPPYFFEATRAGCVYDTHIHAPDGIIHIESPSSTATYSLQNFLDVWGVSLSPNGFWAFSGPTRVFLTDESTGKPGSYAVTEITNANYASVILQRHFEITIEVGAPYVNTPNYSFAGGL